MTKLSSARKYHGQAQLVGSGNDLSVAHGAARLYERRSPCACGLLYSVGKRKKGIRRNRTTGQRLLRLQNRDLDRIHAAHLARTDTQSAAGSREDNGVRFNVLCDLPAE